MAVRGRQRSVDPALMREYAEDDRLSAAANAGDRAAAGQFLLRNQRFLLTTARRLGTGAIDPDDLLADALVNLLALWKAGTGPTEKAGAYVIRSMRNRLIDEFRSPRSRVLPLSDAEDTLPTVTMDTRHIELAAEYRRVREALLLLPADQQQVLRATIIDGRKPAELEEEFDRSAPSISALSLRARKSLRRALLRVMLEENAPPEECRHAASRLPAVATEDVDDAADSPGMEHIRDCPRCRGAWARFASTASLLGVVTLLVVGTAVLAPTSAEASEERRSEHPSSEAPPAPRASLAQRLASAWPMLAIITGLGILLAVIVPPVIERLTASAPAVDSDLVVTSVITEAGRATLDISLTGDEESSTIALTLPAGMAVASTPDAWDCTPADAVLTCEIDGAPAGVIALTDDRVEQVGDYRLEVSAVVGERTLAGTAWGQIGSQPQSVRASVD